jgi:hypothetical protein
VSTSTKLPTREFSPPVVEDCPCVFMTVDPEACRLQVGKGSLGDAKVWLRSYVVQKHPIEWLGIMVLRYILG